MWSKPIVSKPCPCYEESHGFYQTPGRLNAKYRPLHQVFKGHINQNEQINTKNRNFLNNLFPDTHAY